MKKRNLFLPLLLTLVVSCTNGTNSESSLPSETTSQGANTSENSPTSGAQSDSESPVTSEPPSTSETPVTSENPSTSEPPSSEPEIILNDIAEIRQVARTLASQVNERMVATSNHKVELRAQLLNLQDYVTSQNGYTYRNKALIANETGYILVSMDANAYSLIKGYVAEQQIYDFKGTISLYNGEPEITLSQKATYIAGATLNYNLPSIDETSISNVFDELKETPTNSKGIGYKVEVKTMPLKYVMKLENSLGLFSDGTNLIQVYGHDKVTNGWSLNSVYNITFVPGLFIYKPTFNYISHASSDVEIGVLEVSETMSATELYGYDYVQEPKFASDKTQNLAYAELFINAFVFEGYVNFYQKGGDFNISFDDTAKDYYTSYTSATQAKSLFINNESGLTLYTQTHFNNCVFWDEANAYPEEKSMVEFIFTPYLRNTNKYFQIQVFEETYQVRA